MMDITTACEAIGGAATAIGSTWAAIKHMQYGRKFKKEKERQEILDKASEEMAKIEAKLSIKINQLEVELATQKENVSRDFSYVKETYNNEIKGLGEKIEDLREQLNTHHSQLIGFLTKLIDNK